MRALRPVALPALALAAGGCAALLGRPPPSEPSAREGWVTYRVGDLLVEAPSGWQARGDGRGVRIEEPAGSARLEVNVREERFPDEKACLAEGEEALRRGEEGLERVRRHPSRLAGRPAVAQEADRGHWHGWAFAVCDGGLQYRIFFTALATAPPEVMEVHKALLAARLRGTS